MKDLFKKAFYLGVGAVSVTAEKIESLVDELVQRGAANQSERGKLIEEFMEKAREQEKILSAKVKEMVQTYGFATKRELDELRQRLETLEKQAAPKPRRTRKPKTEKAAADDAAPKKTRVRKKKTDAGTETA